MARDPSENQSTPSGRDETDEARSLLKAIAASDPEFSKARLGDVLRHVPGKRVLFSGWLEDSPVVIRHYFQQGGMKQAWNQWAEMTRVCAYLDAPPYRINKPLYLNEENRILVVERVRGRPLLNHMRRVDDEERARLGGEAIRWLRAYSAPTEEWGEARVNSWVTRAEDACARQPHDRLREVEAQVLAGMHRLAGQIGGQSWRKAICHGDFHPNNLLVTDDGLVGIDIGGSDRIPLYKDMARFLVHLARRGAPPSGRRRYGVDAALFEEFAVVFEMNGTEMGLFLPFMIGFEILFRVEQKDIDEDRLEKAMHLAWGWLAELG